MKILFIILLILLALTMAAGWYMARFACLRKKNIPDYWTHPEALPPVYEHIAEKDYPLIYAGREFLLTHAEPPVYITSRDGLRLQGHYIPTGGEYAPKGSICRYMATAPIRCATFPGAPWKCTMPDMVFSRSITGQAGAVKANILHSVCWNGTT